MKAKITVRRGPDLIFKGVVESEGSEPLPWSELPDHRERFLKDVYAIEQIINHDGRYRCHVEEAEVL